MTDQTSIPVPPAPDTGDCAWCGTRTRLFIVLEKARWGTAANGGRELRKPEKKAWVCERHDSTLQRTPAADRITGR